MLFTSQRSTALATQLAELAKAHAYCLWRQASVLLSIWLCCLCL